MSLKKMNTGSMFRLAAVLSVVFIAPVPAQAQEYGGGGSGAAMGQQGGQSSYDRATLENFVDASQSVQEVAQEYQGKLVEAETPEEQQQIQQEASRQMTRAVRDSGMEVPVYNEISQQARQDPELSQRILQVQNS